MFGGNADFPHEVVLAELSPAAERRDAPGVCPSRSGLLVSYRGLVEYINVYNDGTIFYKDALLNEYHGPKLSGDELAALMEAFADSGFDKARSSLRPMGRVPDRHSLTLICTRDQYVSLPGHETTLAPLLKRIEWLKDRATSQTSYMLMFKEKIRQRIFEWPYPEVPLSRLARQDHPRIANGPEDEKVPPDILSRMAAFTAHGGTSETNADVFWNSDGKMYRVYQPSRGDFRTMGVFEVMQPKMLLRDRPETPEPTFSGSSLSKPAGVFWPAELEVRLAQVGKDGLRLSPDEYRKHWPFYFELFAMGSGGLGLDIIDDGYLYRGVRICRVDPQQPRTRCTEAYASTH